MLSSIYRPSQLAFSVLANRIRCNSTFSIKEDKVSVPWGHVSTQIFGDNDDPKNKPIVSISGLLDNSNSFRPLAKYLCKSGYYIISVDLPGHGFSSPLPLMEPINLSFNVATIRRVVKKYDLKNFIFLNHSYGCGLGLMYSTCFKNEVLASLLMDWAFLQTYHNLSTNLSEVLPKRIDDFLRLEPDLKKQLAKQQERNPKKMDHKKALSIILKGNPDIDEESAKCLMERSVRTNSYGDLEFTRDIQIKYFVPMTDHFYELRQMMPDIISKTTSPILALFSNPPYQNVESANYFKSKLDQIREASKVPVKYLDINASHYLHMAQPELASNHILEFLKSNNL